ncbi:putative virulence factor [Salmonella enterica subsp. enterica]|uniref:Putative virulence factor n=1 Tax=Salmonella enterica I TaxID=59201 RepID=A0A447U347_SALET|nr:putative virulence factor [Salmonella enterica subsp. enterica]
MTDSRYSACRMKKRLPVFSPQYSRSTLMTHMLCEILAQALGQINSVATRLRLGFPASPRQPTHPDFNAAFRHAETGARNFPPANV